MFKIRNLNSIWVQSIVLSVAVATASFAGAEASAKRAPDIKAQQAAMSKLAFLRGHWVGEKRSRKADGSVEISRSRDDIELSPDGLLLKIQGRGYAPGAAPDTADVASNFGVVRFDEVAQRYQVHAFALGNALTGSGAMVGDGVAWILEGPGQKVRFVLKPSGADGWIETGDFSFDGGNTWTPAFEIRFQRAP